MDDPFETTFRDEKVEDVHDLLEERWFYRKPLNRKPPTIVRCNSYASPNFDQQSPPKSSSTKKGSSTRKAVDLISASSLPPSIGSEEEGIKGKEKERKSPGVRKSARQLSDLTLATKPTSNLEKKVASHVDKEKGSNKIIGQPSNVGLQRAPSLPVYFGREEESSEDDEGDDISMSRLILQAMPNSSCGSYPRSISKSIMQSSTMPKYPLPRSSMAVDNIDPIRVKKTRNRPLNHGKLKKTLSNLEYQEVQGFKDLGFSFSKEELNPRITELLPDFEGKRKISPDQYKLKSPDLPEAWHLKTCATPILIWAGKNSSEDMKAQLKFWARAVASNVR